MEVAKGGHRTAKLAFQLDYFGAHCDVLTLQDIVLRFELVQQHLAQRSTSHFQVIDIIL